MKRLLLVILMLSLSACATTNRDAIASDHYRTLYTELINKLETTSSSVYFNAEATLSALDGARYRYDVFIDEPQIAMYDIEILVIVDDGSLVISETMMPSVGIFDENTYHMLPYQVHPEKGFVKGFGLNGITDQSKVKLKVLVSWKDVNRIETFKQFIGFDLGIAP